MTFPEPDREALRSLMERFAREQWIESSLVTRESFEVVFSDKGQARMAVIVVILKKLVPGLFDPGAERPGELNSVPLTLQLFRALSELEPPAFSVKERTALESLAVCVGREFATTRKILKHFKGQI